MPYRGEPYDKDYFVRPPGPVIRPEGYQDYTQREGMVRSYADDIESVLVPVSGLRVLDVGCAYGFLTDELAIRGANVTGLDISSHAISEARLRFPSRDFVEADATATSFSNNTFDLVILAGVVECMPDLDTIKALLEEIKRVMKPQGQIYCLIAHPSDSDVYIKGSETEWEGRIAPLFSNKTVTVTDVGHRPILYKWRVTVV